jgi:hypothetical protein
MRSRDGPISRLSFEIRTIFGTNLDDIASNLTRHKRRVITLVATVPIPEPHVHLLRTDQGTDEVKASL